jgi:hypothetical protein
VLASGGPGSSLPTGSSRPRAESLRNPKGFPKIADDLPAAPQVSAARDRVRAPGPGDPGHRGIHESRDSAGAEPRNARGAGETGPQLHQSPSRVIDVTRARANAAIEWKLVEATGVLTVPQLSLFSVRIGPKASESGRYRVALRSRSSCSGSCETRIPPATRPVMDETSGDMKPHVSAVTRAEPRGPLDGPRVGGADRAEVVRERSRLGRATKPSPD